MTCVFINHGLLRKGEPEQAEEVLPSSSMSISFMCMPTVMPEPWPAWLSLKRSVALLARSSERIPAVAQQLETDAGRLYLA